MEHKIEIRDLHYRVPTREILHDVSLQVDKNQFVGLIGPNGSGKTTLLKHIYRALPPEKNTVFINGREIEAFSCRETARQVTVMRQENGSDFVLDEPTNHLDVHYQWLLMEVIAGLKKTVLSVFHELNLACTFCDYLFVLKDGRIAAQGTPKEICTPQMLEEVFRVRADVLALEDGRPYIVYRGSIR